MIVIHKIPYREGELRLGWASWDDGSLTERSVKYAYRDISGKVSRGAPEVSTNVLLDMVAYAADQGHLRLATDVTPVPIDAMNRRQQAQELRTLESALSLLRRFGEDYPWADFGKGADELEARREQLAQVLGRDKRRSSLS